MKPCRPCLLLFCATLPLAAFDLARHPMAAELVLGTVNAEVQPIRQQRIKAPATGLLHLRLPPPGTPAAKGAVWAELDPARLGLEHQALDLARDLLAAKEEPALRLEHVRNRADLGERLDELERQAAMLRRLVHEPDLADLYLSEAPGRTADPDRIGTMLALLDRQAGLLRDVLAYVGSPRQDELEIRALRLKLEQQQLEFDQRVRDRRLIMPFNGEITLVPPLPPAGEPLPIENGMDLARLQDFSRISARAVIRRTEWRLLDPSRISLRIATGSDALGASFTRSLAEEVFGREELVYYFSFDPAQNATARPLVGGQVSAQLIASLPAPAYLVPKLELVLADPTLFRKAGWVSAVPQLIPGARVVLVGETEVAIVAAQP